MRKIVIMLVLLMLTFCSDTYAEPLAYNDKIFDMTIGEAKKYSNDSNPMDMLIDYRSKYGKDIFSNYNPILTELGENEGVDLYVGDANYDINEEVQEGIDTIMERYKTNDNNLLSYSIILIIFLGLTVVLCIKFKNKLFFVVPILLFLALILPTLIKNNPFKTYDSLNEYLKNKGIEISNNVIKSEQVSPFGKMDVAYELNYLIDDLNDIYYEKNSDEPFFFDESLKTLGDKYLGKDNKQMSYNYLEKEKMLYNGIDENTESINIIRKIQPISYYDIVGKIEDKFEEDFDDYKYLLNLINRINIKVNFNEPKDIDKVFEYAERVGALRCFNWQRGYEITRYLKDWYIEGDDKIIELPYGMYLHYKAPKLLKKDVKEILCVNINELDPLSEENILKVFYLDSNDNLKYDFTICKFIEEDGKQKLYYEPYTILYDVRCASTVFSMNKELEYVDNRPTEVLVKKN